MIRRYRIDIIHLNNGFIPREAMKVARMTGVPCIVHLRGFPGKGTSESLTRSVTHVIAVSNAVGASVRENGIHVPAVTTIHDPVDVELTTQAADSRERVRRQCGLAPREIAIGIFGRVIPWKGQLEFVEAMIIAIRGNESLRAVIVGDESDGDRRYFDAIRTRIRDARMEEAFILTGYRRNVEEYYAAVDIVVHASITPEPFGMVVPEAMAAGRPIIAADAGGPREVIEHGIDGLLFPPGDVDALSSAISTLAADPDLRARMATAGVVKAAARFGITSNARQVAAVYEAVLHSERFSTE
jgi:glycosyltransferase involved in cell wall biosynthesis